SEGDYSSLHDQPGHGGGWCFRCLLVTGPLGSVKVRVVDECPTCNTGALDLSPAAFREIGLEIDGRIPVGWEETEC
ncbi:MAG: hypothetical protein DHS80DRAFT_17165, partial [Piptocephalis tieghemiana]